MLSALKGDRSTVCDAMVFALNNAEVAEEVLLRGYTLLDELSRCLIY